MTDLATDTQDYDRAVALAESLGVRVVETTQDAITERWGSRSSAVLVTRGKSALRAIIGNLEADPMAPGERRIFLAENRHGQSIAVLHELGHAALNHGWDDRRDTASILKAEMAAWVWALHALGREPTPAERRDITLVLMGYGARMKEIRTHVLLTNDAGHGILSVPPTKEA